MNTIFTVNNEDLERLNPQEAVDFFRELLWAEARRIGIPINKIYVSSLINVPDGGIDAWVEEGSFSVTSNLIFQGSTGYQIKASDSWKPWQDAQIKKELFERNTPTKNNLNSSIRDCLDKNGTYVLVCFRQDITDKQYKQATGIIKNYFEQCGYQNPKVQIWIQNNLIGFLTLFPSLSLKIKRMDGANFQSHRSWSQDDDMKKEFKAGLPQNNFVCGVQTELRKNDEAVHIRICGEPGIGKTKLILEATRAEDLSPLVLYFDSASKFIDSNLMNEIVREDNQFSLILVIDECDQENRSLIWNKLKHHGTRIKIVSICNEYDETSGNIIYFPAPPLDNEQISNIIQEYRIPKDKVDRYIELCSGSPRVAHVIGWNIHNNPEDLWKPRDAIDIWERYIVGGDDPDDLEVHQRRTVLNYLALFKRFGFGRPVIKEAQAIAMIIENADRQITWQRFEVIINKLRKRKILQGETTLYITPKALHVKLWTDWWSIHGNSFDIDKFAKQIPPTLLDWFYEMFVYASESKIASKIVKELLGEKGPFLNYSILKTNLGSKFFLTLTEADPGSALGCLKRTIAPRNKEELLQFSTGRRNIIWALEIIAAWKDLFADAARLLLALGEAENETCSNNASGIFAQLFLPATAPVAPTEASPQERFPLLTEALHPSSTAKERRVLGLHACDQALQTGNFPRVITVKSRGLQKEPQLRMSKTDGEIFDAYKRV